MPIDPNIALGIRPPEPTNMLGQMAQVMAIRQAQQEMEGNQGVNELARKGERDPYAYLQHGKQGQAAAASITKIQKEKLESDEKRSVMLGGLAGPVMENPTPTTFNFALDRAVNYGLMTPTQKQEVMAQYGGSPEAIKGYAAQIFKGSISAQAQQSDATSRANAATAAAPGHARNALEREKYNDQLATGGETKALLIPDPENPGQSIEVQHRRDIRSGAWVPMGVQAPPMQVNISPSSATATPVAATGGGSVNNLNPANGNVNAMNPNAPVVTSNVPAPALATVRGAAPTYKDIVDPTNPKQMITIDPKVYRGGGVDAKNVRAPGVIGVAGKEPTAALREQKTIGAEEALKGELDNLRFAYGKLNEAEAIPSTARSGLSNIGSSMQASGTGQFVGKVLGTTEQSLRDNIKSSNLRLLQSIKNATGMSAQELNSNMELKTWVDSLTDPKTAYETNMKNIDNIENFVKKRANRGGAPADPLGIR